VPNFVGRSARLEVTRPIPKGGEIFVGYGAEYWRGISSMSYALWGPEGAKRMISRTPNAVLGKKPALARARQEEASVTDFHASMDAG